MILFYVLVIFQSAECSRILGVQHVPARSHYLLMDVILKELAYRGHDVTMITHFEDNTVIENFKSIVLTGAREKLEDTLPGLLESERQSVFTRNMQFEMIGLNLSEEALMQPKVKKLLTSDVTFDMVILEQFLDEALRGFCYHYNAYCISICTLIPSRWANPHVGNVGLPSVVPDILESFTSKMNFVERLKNTVTYVFANVLSQFYFLPKHDELLHKYFPNAPSVYELMYNTSLVLVNSHLSVNYATAYVPNMVEVGGFHISPQKPLPKELQNFLDGAKEGAIYFSMGSNLNTTVFTNHFRDQLLGVFSKLKQKVLMKWHNDSGTKNSNILIKNWFSQNDVLAHPNVKLFITHGGMLSTIEAVHHGVPLLGIPVYADQTLNLKCAVALGYAEILPFLDFSVENFQKLLQVLEDSRYAENIRERSNKFHHRPLKPLETAIFWIEYVLQHGADHLKTSALELKWFQYYLLDVIALLTVGFCLAVTIFWIALQKLLFKHKRKCPTNKKHD